MRLYLIAVMIASSLACAAQQTNGRLYSPPVATFGMNTQEFYDSGDQLYMLFTPFQVSVSGPGLSTSHFSACRVFNALGDGAATWGCGIYSDVSGTHPGSLLCSATATGSSTGWNTLPLAGCPAATNNTQYWIAQISSSSTMEPGISNATRVSSALCPGTSLESYYSSSPLGSVSFPATAPSVSAQSFCYTATVDLALGTNRSGLNYSTPYGIPVGPWGTNGTWYGGQYSPAVYVNFARGLTSGVTPTPTTLGNSSLGAAVTWTTTADDPNGNMGAGTFTFQSLISPVSIGGSGYGGGGSVVLQYSTNATNPGGYYGFSLATSYTTMSMGYMWQTDMPQSTTGQYDQPGLTSADSTDNVHWQLAGSGQSLEGFAECQSTSGGTTNSPTAVPILTGTPYWIGELKQTNGLPNTVTFYELTAIGPIDIGTVTCNSGTGSHPAQNVIVGVGGSEPQVSGYHFYYQNIEISTTGSQVGP